MNAVNTKSSARITRLEVTTVRVVAGVHHGSANAGAAAHQALAAGAAKLDLAVLHVADLADGGHAFGEDAPDLT